MAHYVLHPLRLQKLASQWLLEDTTSFDCGGAVVSNENSDFVILFKSPGMLAGIPFADAIFQQMGLKAEWRYKDGDRVHPMARIGTVSGQAKSLLLAERVVLNVLSRACGVATAASEMSEKLRNFGWKGCLAGTRKTTPGFRMVEKYALLVGGADMHRYDLSGMIMLKDNHVSINGSIAKAVETARTLCGFTQKIEVECRSLHEALQAAEAGCDIIMLDNFEPEDLHCTAEKVKQEYPSVLVEASGGVTSDNILGYASRYIDIISSSTLIQGYSTVDISMKFLKKT